MASLSQTVTSPEPLAPRNQLAAALLYTTVGGYLDANAYLAHGHVFACAQTGNVVLLAVHLSEGDWTQAVRHIPPIATFTLGVLAVTLTNRRWNLSPRHLRLWSAALEIAVLGLVVVLCGRLPDALVVPMISFASAVQITSFRTVERWAFNSTMTTGNLRDAAIALGLWLTKDQAEENRAKSLALGGVCVAFLTGALLGGFGTRHLGTGALLPCLALVAVGAWISA